MDNKRLAIRFFTKLKGTKQSINNVEFNTAINELKHEAENGLEEEEVDTLIDALVYIEGLASKKFRELLKWIIPRQRVSADSASKLLQWIFTYRSTAPFGSVVAALEWITGLVEFGLTDENSIHAFYHHYYLFLQDENKSRVACKLIYLITKPSDVLRWVVLRLLNIEKKYGKQNHITALLGLFKSYKPECVPETVAAISLEFAFKKHSKMDPYFHRAQRRLGSEYTERHKRKIVWNIEGSNKRAKPQRTAQLIAPVDYVHFESERYRPESLHSILKFKTITALAFHHHELDMVCNVMSLLQNDAGLHIITFGDKELQSRFSFNLYYTLYRVFIQKEAGYSYEEKEHLLNQIVALEEYMLQGIPVVSRFLANYICMWDCEDFRQQILHLLQWVTFSSYAELHDLILVYIRTMFLCGSIEVKSSVIDMFNKFVENLIIFGLRQGNKNVTHIFLKNEEDWNGIETVQSIIEFVSKLCELGLRLEQGNYLLLHQTLNFFEMLIFLEERYELPMWTMAPPIVLYSGLITRNALMMSRVCKLLLRYENVYPRLKKLKLRKKFAAKISDQDMYLTDFINCLLKGMCFANRGSYLFGNVPDKHIRSLSKYIIPNEALVFKNHFAMLPYIALMQKDSSVLQSFAFEQEDILIIIRSHLQEIHNLIELANAK